MTHFPILSVIIPVYRVEKYLKEALDSVLAQTIYNIEIIAVDDHSDDACPKILDEYAKKDDRIIVIHKDINQGYGAACNKGLELAKGRYVAIFEPDDTVDKCMYENLINIAEDNSAEIVKSPFYEKTLIDGRYYVNQVPWNLKFNMPKEIFTIKEYPIFLQLHPSIWSCIYNRDFLISNNIKFQEIPGAGWSDNLFQVQTMCKANKIFYTPNAYYYWRKLHENPSDELKDYKIPLERSVEINNWLIENYYTDTNILENIYKRELEYMKIVLGMREITDLKDCYERIRQLCKTMDSAVIKNSYILTDKDKSLYLALSKGPQRVRQKLLMRNFRRNMLSFKFSKNKCFLKLLGRYLFLFIK